MNKVTVKQYYPFGEESVVNIINSNYYSKDEEYNLEMFCVHFLVEKAKRFCNNSSPTHTEPEDNLIGRGSA